MVSISNKSEKKGIRTELEKLVEDIDRDGYGYGQLIKGTLVLLSVLYLGRYALLVLFSLWASWSVVKGVIGITYRKWSRDEKHDALLRHQRRLGVGVTFLGVVLVPLFTSFSFGSYAAASFENGMKLVLGVLVSVAGVVVSVSVVWGRLVYGLRRAYDGLSAEIDLDGNRIRKWIDV